MRLFIFGFGFTGRALARWLVPQGWAVSGAARSPHRRHAMDEVGVHAVDPADHLALHGAAVAADAVLIAAPPDPEGCPGLRALGALLASDQPSAGWIGYLSTTGVYGDRGGRWVSERSILAPCSPEGERRAAAEAAWLSLARSVDRPLAIFRLPGIYGPGRSALDRLRAGDARRLVKAGHVFSRIHVDDLARGLEASMRKPPSPGSTLDAIYNLCDDEPAPASDVTAWAAALLGVEAPPEQALDMASLTHSAQRFWGESKRVTNARAKAELGWRPAYPSYREGLTAILAAESGQVRSLAPAPFSTAAMTRVESASMSASVRVLSRG